MKKTRRSTEQIIWILRKAEDRDEYERGVPQAAGASVVEGLGWELFGDVEALKHRKI